MLFLGTVRITSAHTRFSLDTRNIHSPGKRIIDHKFRIGLEQLQAWGAEISEKWIESNQVCADIKQAGSGKSMPVGDENWSAMCLTDYPECRWEAIDCRK